MKAHKELDGRVLRLEPEGNALIRRPVWPEDVLKHGDGAGVVAMDLRRAEFVSGAFLTDCAELARQLSAAGRKLVLLNLSAHQQRLLELVAGGERLRVLDNEEDLATYVLSVPAGFDYSKSHGGVSNAEKEVLWG
jgi:anti-anti-sigma regulatory factor